MILSLATYRVGICKITIWFAIYVKPPGHPSAPLPTATLCKTAPSPPSCLQWPFARTCAGDLGPTLCTRRLALGPKPRAFVRGPGVSGADGRARGLGPKIRDLGPGPSLRPQARDPRLKPQNNKIIQIVSQALHKFVDRTLGLGLGPGPGRRAPGPGPAQVPAPGGQGLSPLPLVTESLCTIFKFSHWAP